MKKALLLIVAVFTMSSLMAQYTVTFNVDMSEAENFDPAIHDVYIAGDFLGWVQPGENPEFMLEPTIDDPNIYTFSYELPDGDTVVNYKYFLVEDSPNWDNSEWPGDPNRRAALKAERTINDTWGDQPVMVTFYVDMSPMEDFYADTMDVYISGSLADWPEPGNVAQLQLAATDTNDMYYTLTWPVYVGDIEYKYFIVYQSEASSWDHGEWAGGDNRMVTITADTTIINIWSVLNAGIDEPLAATTIELYPNPVQTNLSITSDNNNSRINKVDIYSINGALVKTVEDINLSKVTVEVIDLVKGTYFVKLKTSNGEVTKKFIKD